MGLYEDLATVADPAERARRKAQALHQLPNLVGRTYRPGGGVTITLQAAAYVDDMLMLDVSITKGGQEVQVNGPFYFYNPPVLVDDPAGPITVTWTDPAGTVHERKLREDLVEALRQMVMGVLGKYL